MLREFSKVLIVGVLFAASLIRVEERREYAYAGGWGGKGDGRFEFLQDIAVSPSGDILAVDGMTHALFRFSSSGALLDTLEFGPPEVKCFPTSYTWPNAVDVSPDGLVYVVDGESRRMERIKFNHSGPPVRKTDFITFNESTLPDDLSVGPDGVIYLTFLSWCGVELYSDTGSYLRRISPVITGGLGGFWCDFEFSFDIAVAPNGDLYVVDGKDNYVTYFAPDGSRLGAWGREGSGDGEFDSPYGVAVGPDGTVFVADTGNHRVQYFTAAGSFLGSFGGFGSGEGEFYGPSSIAVAPDGTVYVADSRTDRIQYFRPAAPGDK